MTSALSNNAELTSDNEITDPTALETKDKIASDTSSEVTIIRWDTEYNKYCPFQWTENKKWLVAGITMLGTFLLSLNGTSITVAAEVINEEFGVSDAQFPNSFWPVTSWSLGGAVFLLLFLPWLEDLGVRAGYIVTYIVFYCFIIGQAVAQNFATLIITRFFSGGCVAMLATIVSSMIADIWETDEERSVPVSVWIIGYVAGPTLAPAIFAPVIQYLSTWRWIFYIQLILYGVFGPVAFLVLRETRGDIILKGHARHLRAKTGRQVFTEAELSQTSVLDKLRTSAVRPIYMLFTEPLLFATTMWSSFCFGTVFLFTQSTAQVFITLYDWDFYSTGYVQAAMAVGEVLGWGASFYGTRLYIQSKDRNKETPGKPIPEARLYVSVFASFVGLAGGMFVYAWTSYPSIPWIAPAVGLAMVGFGIQVVISAATDYLVDAYAVSDYAGSAVSAGAFGENFVAGLLPLAAQSMYQNLGLQWASSLLAFIAIGLSCIPLVFIWKGRWLRMKSPFMQGSLVDRQ